jgi:hypothetical protein
MAASLGVSGVQSVEMKRWLVRYCVSQRTAVQSL